MRAIIYFESVKNTKDGESHGMVASVKKHSSKELAKLVGIELRERLTMNNVISHHLKTIKPNELIEINKIPAVIEQNQYYIAIINKLIDRLVALSRNNVKGGGLTERFRLGFRELKNRTKRIKNNVKNTVYLQFIASNRKRKFLYEINRVFYYSFEKMIDDAFNGLEQDFQTGEIEKKRVVSFFAKISVSTFMVAHITCSYLSNFVGFMSKEIP